MLSGAANPVSTCIRRWIRSMSDYRLTHSIVITTRKRALPLIIRSYPSLNCSSL
jgi:hypothetical protein